MNGESRELENSNMFVYRTRVTAFVLEECTSAKGSLLHRRLLGHGRVDLTFWPELKSWLAGGTAPPGLIRVTPVASNYF